MGPIPCIPVRESSPLHEDDNRPGRDFTENENENHLQFSYMLFTPTLEDLKNVLSTALSPFFEEFEIAVVSCPCLTREPYNLAAAGLSGNTGILHVGHIASFYPSPRTDLVYDIQDILSRCSNDAFVIGSGLTAQPAMPHNGHLTINAIVSANPTNVINNSCIAYKDDSTSRGWRTLEDINDQNQIKCCLFGQFFFSEGKRGPVIKMRAKGRRSRSNIISLIQIALKNLCRYQQIIGLGFVILINGGQTDQRLLPDDFVRYAYKKPKDYYDRLNKYQMNCKNVIALGSLISERLIIFGDNKKVLLPDICSMFNVLYNDDSAGQFFNDLTPDKTEYIVYINIAQDRFYDC